VGIFQRMQVDISKVRSTIFPMKMLFFTTPLFFFLAGCMATQSGQASTQSAGKKRLTLKDLQASTAQKITTRAVMDVLAFEVPRDRVSGLKDYFKLFEKGVFRVKDAALSLENGIIVFGGSSAQRSNLSEILQLIKAKISSRASLLMIDQEDEFYTTATLYKPRPVFRTMTAGLTSQEILGQGRFGLSVSVQQSLRMDEIDLSVCPAFISDNLADIRLSTGMGQVQRLYDFAQAEVTMKAGDFLIFVPTRTHNQTTIDTLLFDFSGKKDRIYFYIIIRTAAGGG